MLEHRTRLLLIALLFALVLLAAVVLQALGRFEGELAGALTAGLGIFGPALIDAGLEQRRRGRVSKTPDAPVSDSGGS